MIIVTHTDLDGICSAALFIRKYGSNIKIIYSTVKDAQNLAQKKISIDYTCDLPKVGKSINIDHHRSNYEQLKCAKKLTQYDQVDPNAASTTELVYEFLGFKEDNIAKDIRLLGHLADTAQLPDEYRQLDIVLSMNNDNNEFLRETSSLLAEKGHSILKTQWLKDQYCKVTEIYEQTKEKIHLFFLQYSQLPRILILDIRDYIPNKLAKEVFKPIFERNVAVIALIYYKSEKDPLRVSFRVNKHDQEKYDVSIVAEAFGGGGHRMASACSLKIVDIPEKLINELKKISSSDDDLQYIHL